MTGGECYFPLLKLLALYIIKYHRSKTEANHINYCYIYLVKEQRLKRQCLLKGLGNGDGVRGGTD